MIPIGCFSEMHIFADNGSVKEHLTDSLNYDKKKMIAYLESFKARASCPRNAIDCITGKIISQSFKVYDDGEYCWCDFLLYHIKKYNIHLPDELIKKSNAQITA